MKKLVSFLVLIAVSSAANALSSNVQIVAKNNTIETELCVVAAQQGIEKAAEQAALSGVTAKSFAKMHCNGTDIKSFAATYTPKDPVAINVKATVILAGNQSDESKLCVKAVTEGIKAIGHIAPSLKCNGESVSDFVNSVAKS